MKLIKGQGHKVNCQGQICNFVKKKSCFDMHETKKSTQGQGQKVKGQGQICNFVKKKTHPFLSIFHEPNSKIV